MDVCVGRGASPGAIWAGLTRNFKGVGGMARGWGGVLRPAYMGGSRQCSSDGGQAASGVYWKCRFMQAHADAEQLHHPKLPETRLASKAANHGLEDEKGTET